GHHRIGAKAGRSAQKRPDRHSWRATQQPDQRSSRCPDSRAKQVAILGLEKRDVPTIVLLEHRASLQLKVGRASLLEVLDRACSVVSRIGVIECRNDNPVRHGTLLWCISEAESDRPSRAATPEWRDGSQAAALPGVFELWHCLERFLGCACKNELPIPYL